MANINFNAATVEPDVGFTPIPAGSYLAQATESEIKTTSTGGQMAQYTMQILEGQFAGRKVWARFNIVNANPDAQRIGQAQLSAFCHAADVINMTDTEQLHGVPVKIKVVIKKDEQYGDKNEVKGFERADGKGRPAPAAARPSAFGAAKPTPPKPAASAGAPWATKSAA